jgi:hypothetical protein
MDRGQRTEGGPEKLKCGKLKAEIGGRGGKQKSETLNVKRDAWSVMRGAGIMGRSCVKCAVCRGEEGQDGDVLVGLGFVALFVDRVAGAGYK